MTYVLAIDIGGTNTKLALIDSVGNVGEVTSIPTDGNDGTEKYLHNLSTAAETVIRNHQTDVEGVGIGVAGFIDPLHTRMTFNPNISWLEDVPIKEYFSNQLSLPVNIEIDSNAAALAEAVYGNGKESRRLLVYTIGTGLGGGMIVDGSILRISNECLGDVGHVIVEPGGPQCGAGCRGCAEALVSAPALENFADELLKEKNTAADKKSVDGHKKTTSEVINAANQGDIVSIKAIQKVGRYLGIALASISPVLAPDKICIAGGVSEAGSILLDAARSNFYEIAGPPYTKGVCIQKALLGWQAVLVGAAEAFSLSNPVSRGSHGL